MCTARATCRNTYVISRPSACISPMITRAGSLLYRATIIGAHRCQSRGVGGRCALGTTIVVTLSNLERRTRSVVNSMTCYMRLVSLGVSRKKDGGLFSGEIWVHGVTERLRSSEDDRPGQQHLCKAVMSTSSSPRAKTLIHTCMVAQI